MHDCGSTSTSLSAEDLASPSRKDDHDMANLDGNIVAIRYFDRFIPNYSFGSKTW